MRTVGWIPEKERKKPTGKKAEKPGKEKPKE